MPSTILLAEDSSDLRRLFTRCLIDHGHVVVQASDGLEAWDALGRITPDVIVTDLMMPNLDGLELIRRIREEPALAEIPILVITAIGGEDVDATAREAGASSTLAKPFDLRAFTDRIDEFVQ